MAKILILANNDVGLYKFRKELLIELIKDNDVYISSPNGKFIPELKKIGCTFIHTEIDRRGTNPLTDLKLLMTYKKILKKICPDVVLTYTIKPNVYGGIACRMSKIPYITNVTGLGTAIENGGTLQKVTLFLNRVALKKASCVFIQNKENEEFLLEHKVIKGSYKRIPGSGVNLDEYNLLDYPPDNVINFLFIARVMKEKGIDQYLEAAKYIKERYPQTIFHVLGFCEQNYEEELKELNQKGIIQYHGMQGEVKKFHEISHCTIHPSYYPEGMSNVLLESAASGRPAITTNRSGCKEIVTDKFTGYIVEEKNSNDLIKKIQEFLTLDYISKKKMGILAREKVELEFDRQIVVNAYINAIKNI